VNALSTFVAACRAVPPRRGFLDALALLALLAPALPAIAIGLNAGEFWWTDEARHAMNSVFIYDFLREGLSADPLDYAFQYFAQYPALALNWYPPGFYVVEGLFFHALGTSELTGRLTVLAFFAAGLIVWYFWVSRFWGRTAAILSGLLFALNPQVVLWTRSLMLDTPATVMVIVSIVLFDRYVEKPGWMTGIVAGLSIAGTLLVKQTTIFLLPTLFF
jgi:predicted membrane-bound mannosyltransferase